MGVAVLCSLKWIVKTTYSFAVLERLGRSYLHFVRQEKKLLHLLRDYCLDVRISNSPITESLCDVALILVDLFQGGCLLSPEHAAILYLQEYKL